MIVHVDRPELTELIDPEAELTLLGRGYELTPSPQAEKSSAANRRPSPPPSRSG